MHERAIELRNLVKTYPGTNQPAVNDVSLVIGRGELMVFVGPSGCGKTTTLRMINCLERPTSGEVLIDGRAATAVPAHQLRRGIGYVIQDVGLFPHRTVEHNVATVLSLLGWDRQRRTTRVRELVELVGLDESLLTRYPAQLSGGQQQRVGLARALAADPPILLMDEPFSAVDPVVRAALQDNLVALHQRLSTTIVLVTHDIEEAVKIGDRVAVFGPTGRIEQCATPSELLAAPASAFVRQFLGNDLGLRRLGLLTVRDVLEARAGRSEAVRGPSAQGSVNGTLPTAETGASLRSILDTMVLAGTDHIAIVNNGQPVDTLSFDEVLAALSPSATAPGTAAAKGPQDPSQDGFEEGAEDSSEVGSQDGFEERR